MVASHFCDTSEPPIEWSMSLFEGFHRREFVARLADMQPTISDDP